MNPPWILVRLGLETTQHHAPADDDRLTALSIRSLGEYRAFLVRVLGFEAPVEQAVSRVRDLEPRFVRERARTPLLEQDLALLDMSELDIARAPRASVAMKSPAEALGWMFVLERHTLLAGLLRRQIRQALGAATPVAYLGAYGDRPGARFREFGMRLAELAQTHAPASIVDGANAAFRAQRQWYGTRGDQVLPTGSGHVSASA